MRPPALDERECLGARMLRSRTRASRARARMTFNGLARTIARSGTMRRRADAGADHSGGAPLVAVMQSTDLRELNHLPSLG